MHTGYTSTNLQSEKFPLWKLNNDFFAMKVEHGVLSQTLAATDPTMKPSMNDFFGPRYLAFGFPVVQKTNKADPIAQKTLWEESNRLTKAGFLI